MSEIDVDAAAQMWLDKVPVAEIAKHFKVSKDKLLRVRNENKDRFPQRQPVNPIKMKDTVYLKAKQLWKDKHSITSIAGALGVTKGVISGMMSRNRKDFPERFGNAMKRHYSATSIPLREKPKLDKRANLSANALRKMFSEAINPRPLPRIKEEAQAYDESRLPGYPLWELDAKGCKFALNDGSPYMFCGETRYQMKPWCKHHHERVWRAN